METLVGTHMNHGYFRIIHGGNLLSNINRQRPAQSCLMSGPECHNVLAGSANPEDRLKRVPELLVTRRASPDRKGTVKSGNALELPELTVIVPVVAS